MLIGRGKPSLSVQERDESVELTDSEWDDPVWDLSGETAVAVEDVAAEHVLRGALAEGGDGWVWRCEVLCAGCEEGRAYRR